MNELAEKIKTLNTELERLDGIIALELCPMMKQMCVHLSAKGFIKLFPDYDLRARADEEYPHELYKDINGVFFFALAEGGK